MIVYAFPPVGLVASEWHESAPVVRSRSLTTGAEFVSATQRRRTIASLDVSALSANRQGAGYVEVLKRLLNGGVNGVRLESQPINWHLDAIRDRSNYQSHELQWADGGQPMDWTADGQPLTWYTGRVLRANTYTEGGFQRAFVTGLPPNKLVARPAEFATFFDGEDTHTAQILTSAQSNENGGAEITFLTDLPSMTGVRVNFRSSESKVFRAMEMPRAMQPVIGNWSYSWEFREVFADEVGGFDEVDPW